MFLVLRVQARLRGLITRKRVKSGNTNKFMPHNDPYGNYIVVSSSKIVINQLI